LLLLFRKKRKIPKKNHISVLAIGESLPKGKTDFTSYNELSFLQKITEEYNSLNKETNQREKRVLIDVNPTASHTQPSTNTPPYTPLSTKTASNALTFSVSPSLADRQRPSTKVLPPSPFVKCHLITDRNQCFSQFSCKWEWKFQQCFNRRLVPLTTLT